MYSLTISNLAKYSANFHWIKIVKNFSNQSITDLLKLTFWQLKPRLIERAERKVCTLHKEFGWIFSVLQSYAKFLIGSPFPF